MYRLVFVADIQFGAIFHPFSAPDDSEARKKVGGEIKKLKSQYGEGILVRHLQRIEKVTRNKERIENIPFGIYLALIRWEVKGDYLSDPWRFTANDDQDALLQAKQHVRKLNQKAEEEDRRKGEDRDGWASLTRLDRVDGTRIVEEEMKTPIPLN